MIVDFLLLVGSVVVIRRSFFVHAWVISHRGAMTFVRCL